MKSLAHVPLTLLTFALIASNSSANERWICSNGQSLELLIIGNTVMKWETAEAGPKIVKNNHEDVIAVAEPQKNNGDSLALWTFFRQRNELVIVGGFRSDSGHWQLHRDFNQYDFSFVTPYRCKK